MTAPFHDALRAELLDAARRDLGSPAAPSPSGLRRRPQRRPRRRLLLLGIAAALASVAAGVAVLTGPSPAGADVEVRVRDGKVVVRVVGDRPTPREVEQAMRDAGLDVEVVPQRVGPSLVGRFLRVAVLGTGYADVYEEGSDGRSFAGFSLPAGWPGTLQVYVGAPARPGQRYDTSSDAFAPGEPLHCADGTGRRVRDLAPELAARNVTATVHPVQGGPLEPLEAALAGELADAYVTRADATSSTEVLLTVAAEPPASAPPEAPC